MSDSFTDTLGGYTEVIYVTPTLTTSAYSANNVLGGVQILSDASRKPGVSNASGVILDIAVFDADAQKIQMDVTLFNANPSASTTANGSALVVAGADIIKMVAPPIVLAAYTDSGGVWGASKENLGIGFKTATANLWFIAVTRGTPTYAADGLVFKFTISQD